MNRSHRCLAGVVVTSILAALPAVADYPARRDLQVDDHADFSASSSSSFSSFSSSGGSSGSSSGGSFSGGGAGGKW